MIALQLYHSFSPFLSSPLHTVFPIVSFKECVIRISPLKSEPLLHTLYFFNIIIELNPLAPLSRGLPVGGREALLAQRSSICNSLTSVSCQQSSESRLLHFPFPISLS